MGMRFAPLPSLQRYGCADPRWLCEAGKMRMELRSSPFAASFDISDWPRGQYPTQVLDSFTRRSLRCVNTFKQTSRCMNAECTTSQEAAASTPTAHRVALQVSFAAVTLDDLRPTIDRRRTRDVRASFAIHARLALLAQERLPAPADFRLGRESRCRSSASKHDGGDRGIAASRDRRFRPAHNTSSASHVRSSLLPDAPFFAPVAALDDVAAIWRALAPESNSSDCGCAVDPARASGDCGQALSWSLAAKRLPRCAGLPLPVLQS